MKDLVIIGSGPAGLSAAVYACNACLDFVVIEKLPMSGGQVLNSYDINNYLGFENADGFTLGQTFRNHAEKLGTEFVDDHVLSINQEDNYFQVKCKNNLYTAKTVIIAVGADRRKLNVNGESELSGKGVSYCATCDGNFFKNKTVAVVGGGDVACEDALYLSNICSKVYLIHRRDTLRGAKHLQNKIFDNEKIEILFNSQVKEICGENRVESLLLDNGNILEVDGVFIAVGITADTSLLGDIAETDESGFIVAGEDCKTSLDGLYAVGDIRTKPLRQISTAVSDGANAIHSVEEYLYKLDKQ